MHNLSDINGLLATQALLPSQIRTPNATDLIVGETRATLISAGHLTKETFDRHYDLSARTLADAIQDILADISPTTFVGADGSLQAGWRIRDSDFLDSVSTRLGVSINTHARSNAFDFFVGETEENSVEGEIELFRELENGWAGDRSVAPAGESVDKLKKLFEESRIGQWLPARAFVAPDGEVGLAWEAGKGYASVSFWNDGSMSYYARSIDGLREAGEELPDGHALPDSLRDILASLG